MAVLEVEHYRQKNGEDVLKVILKSTKVYPKGYFYCDASDEELVRRYTWRLQNQKHPYVVVTIGSRCSQQTKLFHQEKANNRLSYYPDYINHSNFALE